MAVNRALIGHLLAGDRLIIAGQAKSHCVAWTVADLLREIQQRDPQLAQRVYLLEDCMSPVVVPGVVDFSKAANAAFAEFAAAGMHRITTTMTAPLNL
ncbi:tsl0542 [Thermosynechococcus vestitus BP-1]|uniref:Tsl0542 protein n=1 Tax=Thermosynechococcus vestitus (strain NIES-2133 / IAM M-273 / BP-1) TaxID=197221 RepID=Q8DLF1_THEVB|nr:tsl0542 [Thermosynechococcus vestitus BP-1]